jgi:hypothetical protein
MRLIALFVVCVFSGTASGQTSECQSIPKAKERLACYDKTSSPPTPLGNPAMSKTSTAPVQGQNVDPLAAENARTDAAVKNICRGC